MKFILLCLVAVIGRVLSYGEPSATGHPTYVERANFNLINAVRVDPTNYKALYWNYQYPSTNILLSATYPAVAPIYWEPRLGQSSWNHSYEMATKNYFNHSSYDGTPPFTRIGYFYSCNGYMGENIAAGSTSPLTTSNQWLCDAPYGSSACAADGSGSDGHRSNIMSANFYSAGVGYAYNSSSTYGAYWTQDFGGSCTGQTNPIYSGSHYINNTIIKFVAIFALSSAPTSATINLAGNSISLTQELGSTTRGSWVYSTSTASNCRAYYFSFVAGGTTYRYPDTGFLLTNQEGSCTSDFSTSSSATSAPTNAPTAGPTTAPTKAPTAGPTTAATKAPTTGPTTAPTKAPTAGPTTKPPTSAPGAPTATPTAVPATVAPTAAPTAAPTVAPTVAPTAAPTAAPTVAPTAAPASGPQYLYTTNAYGAGWSTAYNSGVQISTSSSYQSQACLTITLGASNANTDFFWFQHAQEANVWSTVTFTAAATSSTPMEVSPTFTTTWTTYSWPMSAFNSPSTVGDAQFVFQNTASSSATIYIQNLYFS